MQGQQVEAEVQVVLEAVDDKIITSKTIIIIEEEEMEHLGDHVFFAVRWGM